MRKNLFLAFVVTICLHACTWVKETPGGEKVRVLSADEVTSCKELGSTSSFLKDKIAGVDRNKDKVKKELQTLARNTAAEMGGDTIVPKTEIEDGKQEFTVYKCINPQWTTI